MKLYIVVLLVWSLLLLCHGLPVSKTKKTGKKVTEGPEAPNVETVLEYERYLKEVVGALEDDPEFKKKLDKAPEADIRNGKIAQELEYVNHRVRTKLNEIKRRELDRLEALAKRKFDLENEIDRDHLKINQHLDGTNEHTFEIEDLEKLIKKISEDLAEVDRKRQAEFKQYELQKEFEKEMIRNELDEEQRKKFDAEQSELKEKHMKHEKVHHPGNKAQLEEVWEKMDHMDKGDYDPRTLFMFHDTNSDNFWDPREVEALFIKELDKVYQSGLPEDDMRERVEEMERMREQVFKEIDTNRDGLISFQEFIEQTKREAYNKDPEWETIEKQPQFTHEEYLEFERRRKKELERMVAQELLPPHPNMPQGYYAHNQNAAYQTGQQLPSGKQQQPQMHYQNSQQQHMQQQQQYEQQQQQYQQYQYQQHPYQQQNLYQEQADLNSNQVYQHIPAQKQHQQQPQPTVNNLTAQQQQTIAGNSGAYQQLIPNNIQYQQPIVNNIQNQQPVATNNILQQQQPINKGIPQQPIKINSVQQQNIPQKHY